MKLQELKKLLKSKYPNHKRGIKQKKDHNPTKDLNNLKIIGITGSNGKSTVAYLVHEYLKSLGYKSVLYCSLKVDSPITNKASDVACEVAFRSEEQLLDIIEEVEAYGADYLILEVNESNIEKEIVKNIPFDVRVLTNLNPKHNLDHYTEEEYVNIKKHFFENVTTGKMVIGVQDYSQELLEELLNINSIEKLTFTSEEFAEILKINPKKMTTLLLSTNSTPEGLQLRVNVDNKEYKLETNVMMNYNALNLVCTLTILQALDILNITSFQQLIKNIEIPGRAEVFKVNGRMIVVDMHLPMMLKGLYDFKQQGLFQKVKVVIGSVGSGFKTWEEKFKTETYKNKLSFFRKAAMDYLNHYADYVYLTENNNAAENVLTICNELQSYLDIPSTINIDRREAIRKAIKESEKGDVIFISGRGNKKILCDSQTTMKLLKDSDVVKEIIEELGW